MANGFTGENPNMKIRENDVHVPPEVLSRRQNVSYWWVTFKMLRNYEKTTLTHYVLYSRFFLVKRHQQIILLESYLIWHSLIVLISYITKFIGNDSVEIIVSLEILTSMSIWIYFFPFPFFLLVSLVCSCGLFVRDFNFGMLLLKYNITLSPEKYKPQDG